eukprot:symbB.v1.2.036574.t1/scaffold5196.1/size29908/3
MPKSVDVSACRPIPGQKDIQGTMLELPEAKFPGLAVQVSQGVKDSMEKAGQLPASKPSTAIPAAKK